MHINGQRWGSRQNELLEHTSGMHIDGQRLGIETERVARAYETVILYVMYTTIL